jgi:hypothetical protein
MQIKTATNYIPGLKFKNSSKHVDCSRQSDFSFEIKPDICVYEGDKHRGPTDVAYVDIIIEFKWHTCDDPFDEPDSAQTTFLRNTAAARDTTGQITAYAAAQLGSQFRTCVYSILIVRDCARLIRWDRTGAVVSAAIKYDEYSHLLDFFRRYYEAPEDIRGVDTTVGVPSKREAKLARECLELKKDEALVKITVPGETGETHYVTRVPTAGPYTPPGRATRGFVAYDIGRKRKVFLKDTWRVDLPDIKQEGETYKLLWDAGVRNIAACSAAADIPNHCTRTHTFEKKSWACKVMIELIPHQHYRLVLDVVGQSLTDFSSSFEMLGSVRDALICKSVMNPPCEYYSLLLSQVIKMHSRLGFCTAISVLETS